MQAPFLLIFILSLLFVTPSIQAQNTETLPLEEIDGGAKTYVADCVNVISGLTLPRKNHPRKNRGLC